MQFDHYTYTVASHYASAIINDDWTGLDDDEAEEVKEWLDSVLQKADHIDIHEDVGFCRDEITGLMADCVIVKAHFSV
jgi:hypothetical protein